MTFIAVRCLHCHSEQVVKRGKTRRGTQRYLCQNTGSCTCPLRINTTDIPDDRHSDKKA
jgi:transposase-like protein